MTATIIFDVDEVLAALVQATTKAAHIPIPYEKTELVCMKQWENLGAVYGAFAKRLWGDPDFWAWEVKPFPDVEELINAGEWDEFASHYTVLFATSPWPACEGWYDARFQWLKFWFSAKPEQYIPYPEKWRIAGDLIVEDMPKHAEAYIQHGLNRKAILVDRPWNQDCPEVWTKNEFLDDVFPPKLARVKTPFRNVLAKIKELLPYE